MLTIVLIILSILLIVISTSRFSLHPFLALLVACLFFGFCSGMAPETIIQTINIGFGETIGKIGIIIISGVIIGAFLEQSGGAYALASQVLRVVGQKRVHLAMGVIGYIVSIPVFADSGFIILSSLNRALAKEAGVSLAGTAIALSLGLTAAHTMVPPTPGPITAAGLVGADLGIVILIGLYTSIGALVVAIFFSKAYAGKVYIDPQPEQTREKIQQKISEAPSSIKSFLPILVPILLIVLRSIADYPTEPFGTGIFVDFIFFLGNPVTALFIGVLLALLLPKKLDKAMLSTGGWVGDALKTGSVIILITGAGGAFGKMLQTSDIGEILGSFASDYRIGLWLPFMVAAGIKTAQGSSTVALTTTASIIAPLMLVLGMDTEIEKAMVVISIGAGSAVVSHANDSFFWVVTQMSGMNVSQGYRLQSVGTAVLGLSAMILLTLLSFIV